MIRFFNARQAANNAGCLVLTCVFAVAFAQSSWLTVVGNPGEAGSNLLEVDPQSLVVTPSGRTLNIRVSRNASRTSTEGIPFRSYTATILVDCSLGTARFVTASFYLMPLWEGKSHSTLTYASSEVRPVLFRHFESNPLPRLTKSACAPRIN